MIYRKTFIILICALFFAASASAQNPTRWSLESTVKPNAAVKAGQKLTIKLKAEVESGWHLYALDQPSGGPIPTTIVVAPDRPFAVAGPLSSDKATVAYDPNFKIDTKFFEDRASFTVPLRATADATADSLALDVRFQLCNDTVCLPPRTKRVSFAGEEDVKVGFGSQLERLAAGSGASGDVSTAAEQAAAPAEPFRRQIPADLWALAWLAATLGALSLLTPCVFPMIPITVSYFTNHSSGSRAKSLRLAGVYSLGIVAAFTLLGMILAIFVGAAGINLFAANPWVNLLIAALFLSFAFSLFGAYEINVPAAWLTKLDSLTRTREGGGGSGVVGALLMGLTFTLTSFTCTSPFVGTILVAASQGSWETPLVGMLAFSIVFAAPFFVLALVPQLVSRLPRAGGWMSSVKVAMGFLEIAAAMKFLSNVDLIWRWGILTRNVILSIWIAIAVILALYLLGKFRLSHDATPDRIGAFRLVSAIAALASAFFMLTGMFGGRLGEIEAFLPPDTVAASTASTAGARTSEPSWILNDYEAALKKAAAENKRVFVDFTGYTCTNCRWMEANMFPRPEVVAELDKFVLARLYTDGDGEIYRKQQAFEQETFGTVALPFYAVMTADGKPVATFPGLTRNTAEFVDFLKAGSEPKK